MVRTCSIDGCDEAHNARGYCRTHYLRLIRYGDPSATNCTRGCSGVAGHEEWCRHSGPRTTSRYYQRLFDRGYWRCNDCLAELPLSSFHIRANGKPVGTYCKDHYASVSKANKLKRYGLSVEQYNEILDRQSGRCAICGNAESYLAVDHDHSCCDTKLSSCGGCVRGLLCGKCNAGLAMFSDNTDVMRKAVEYLAR